MKGLRCALIVLLVAAAPAVAADSAAHQQFVFAYRLLQRGEEKSAADAFRQYLEKHPDGEKRGDARYYLALIAHRGGDTARARKQLKRIDQLALVPAHAAALLRGRVALELGRPKKALAALEAIRPEKREPGFAVAAHLLRGAAYRRAGNPAAAAKQFAAAAALDTPQRATAYKRLGEARRAVGETEAALAAFEKAIELGGDGLAARAALAAARTAEEAGSLERAAGYYRRVLNAHQSSPVFEEAALGLLWMRYEAGDHRAAMQTAARYAEALSGAARAEALYVAGSAAHAAGDHRTAIERLAAAREAGVERALRPELLYRLAASRFEIGALDAARKALDALEGLDAGSDLRARARYLRALIAGRAGATDRSEAALSAIIERGPDAPLYERALRRRAALYRRTGDLERAAADLKRYLRQGARTTARGAYADPEPALALLHIQHRLGRYRAAVHTASRILSGNPAPPLWQETVFRRGLALLRAGKREPALEAFDRLLTRYPRNAFRSAARYYRGLLRMTLGRDGAVADLRSAAAAAGLSADQRARAYRVLFAHFRKAGETKKAMGALEGWRQVKGRSAIGREKRLWMARRLLERDRPKEALAYARSLLEKKPRDRYGAAALRVAGRARLALGEARRAAERLRAALRLSNEKRAATRLALADALAAAGRWKKAEAAYQRIASAEEPRIAASALLGAARAARERAKRFERANNPEGARQAREAARKRLKRLVVLYGAASLSPLPERGYVALAEVLYELGKAEEARSMLEELRARYPDSAYAAYGRALAAAEAGHAAKARQRLAAIGPDAPPRVRKRAKALRARLE